jgi:glycosyltransferase involved in cell wall biosynthesis
VEKPLVNILMRTSKRPKYFEKCLESIDNQTYDNINLIISVDDDETEEYVSKLTDEYIRVNKYNGKIPNLDKTGIRRAAPYNLYLNSLKNQVTDGWIMFLDDDDCFTKDTAIEEIVSNITSDDDLLLWKVQFPNRVIPEDYLFKFKKIQINHISMIGFMYHKKHDHKVKFDYFSGGDFYFMNQLYPKIPNQIWINEIYTSIQRTNAMGGMGKQDDIK